MYARNSGGAALVPRGRGRPRAAAPRVRGARTGVACAPALPRGLAVGFERCPGPARAWRGRARRPFSANAGPGREVPGSGRARGEPPARGAADVRGACVQADGCPFSNSTRAGKKLSVLLPRSTKRQQRWCRELRASHCAVRTRRASPEAVRTRGAALLSASFYAVQHSAGGRSFLFFRATKDVARETEK